MKTSQSDDLRPAMEAFFHAYMAFTAKPDEILARRGLARVHHRILFFIARQPGLSVKTLLAGLRVSKQAINMPLRQLLEMNLVCSELDRQDRRLKHLNLTNEGAALEQELHRLQVRLLERAFSHCPPEAAAHWIKVNQILALGENIPQTQT
jgi:DNA-binding MarR family transcriptional regulator